MDISISKLSQLKACRWPSIDLANIGEEYICPKCKQVLMNVHQTYDCGCRFCFECLKDM